MNVRGTSSSLLFLIWGPSLQGGRSVYKGKVRFVVWVVLFVVMYQAAERQGAVYVVLRVCG
jgi:hypothetical protein